MNWSGILSILGKIGKSILNGMVKVFKLTFSNFKNFIIVLLVILCLVGAWSLYRTKKDLERTKIELVESQDTTFIYKNKAGELYAACETYIADIKELKTANEELYKEYKNLKDHPIIIEKVQTVIKIDSIYIKDDVTVDTLSNMYTADFKFADNYCSISGATTLDVLNKAANTSIYNIEIPATFTTDVIEKNKKLYFLTKCDNPYVQINNIEGAIVSPEQSKVLKKRFNRPWGVMIGVGPSITVVNNTVKVYPSLQLTIGYKFISF